MATAKKITPVPLPLPPPTFTLELSETEAQLVLVLIGTVSVTEILAKARQHNNTGSICRSATALIKLGDDGGLGRISNAIYDSLQSQVEK